MTPGTAEERQDELADLREVVQAFRSALVHGYLTAVSDKYRNGMMILADQVLARAATGDARGKASKVRPAYDSTNCDCYGGCSSCRLPDEAAREDAGGGKVC